ncbi:MAG: hypothetical protein JJE50_02080 [Actinomycetales bacterium]|nr:hypothetical protein [Actinomycetales bacterium]
MRADTVPAAAVAGTDGELAVGQICGALSTLLIAVAVADAVADAVAEDVLASVRGLALDGLLLLED